MKRRQLYDARWRQAAALFRAEHPYCLGCAAIGVTRAAVVIDHIVPHRGNEERFLCEENFQSLCRWHHNSVKPMLERMWRAGKIRDVDLRLSSDAAVKLTKARHRPAIGLDGFAIPNT